ncbi:hypothetical protein ScalyP_jg5740 [Parmales sp. scaly parma]|nr:hypothetical protein ScalyP_jg5740 [Parmales sp. scaly parma]
MTTTHRAAVKALQKFGGSALRASLNSNGRTYRKALVSPRKASVIRKAAIVDKTFGSFDNLTGIGWDIAWDVEKKQTAGGKLANINGEKWAINSLKPFKGKLNERTREERAMKIEEKLEGMDKLIENHRKEVKERTGKKEGVEALYKRIIARAGRR